MMDSIANKLSRTKYTSVWIVLGLLHNLTIYLTHHKRSLSRFLCAYTLLYIFTHRRTAIGVTPRKDLKSPGGSLPLVGDIVKMTFQPRTEVYQLNEKIHKEVGRVFAITLPFVGRVVDFTDPAVLEHVLKTNFWAYEKGEFLRRTFFDLLGNGIFSADGHSWNWQRKMASHIFNVSAFRHYTSEVFVKESYIVADYLGMIAEEERTVDIHKLFYLYTLDSFGEISFGQSFGCLDSPEEGTVEFAEAFDRLNTIVFNRVFTPGWQLTEFLTSRGRQIRKDKQTIASFALKIIRDRRIHGYDKPQKDLLQLCMDMQDVEDGRRLSDEVLKDMVLNFIIADGTRIYKGEFASWSSWTMGRDTTIWGPDAREYDPDRWMTGEKFPAHKFPAFHAGPRKCLGQQFATVEAITILAILLQRFTFELVDPDTEPEYIPGLTLPMANGLPLRVHQRPV
ncbi:hypothetical protein KI688_003246 [Linnemannia hyalina]|uniref:Cytochrome P450 n=1 Tax=Linnemannia hyalina TaxID=64524 RepID=A0A9P7XND7_9FUNG|nr:hypothetical protein KI688_003246 [Linnemannia hyalina]